MDTKVCNICHTEKSVDEFYKRSGGNGYLSGCKSCRQERRKIRDALNRDGLKEYARNSRLLHNDERREYNKNYYHAHLEHCRARGRNHVNRRIAAIMGNGGSHTEAEWETVLEKYNRRCLKCGTTKKITRDHIVPVTKGGSNSIDNLQPLCLQCNASKGNREIIDYRT